MKGLAPAVVLLGLVVLTLISLFGGDSFSRLRAMQDGLEQQHDKGNALESEVVELRREVYGLQHKDRVLEKAARNELGMARPDELIFIFQEKQEDEAKEK